MIATISQARSKKKIGTIGELSGETVYLFGGKNQLGETSDKLFKIKIKEEEDVHVEEVSTLGQGP